MVGREGALAVMRTGRHRLGGGEEKGGGGRGSDRFRVRLGFGRRGVESSGASGLGGVEWSEAEELMPLD